MTISLISSGVLGLGDRLKGNTILQKKEQEQSICLIL